MNNKFKLKEIKECKKLLENSLLGYNERFHIEAYLKSLEDAKYAGLKT